MREVYLFSSEDLELGSEVKWVTLTSASTDAATPSMIQVQSPFFGIFLSLIGSVSGPFHLDTDPDSRIRLRE